MRRLLILFAIGFFLLIGCQKFEYTDLQKMDCSLCNYAKDLEGEYRGFDNSVLLDFHDSVTVFLEQIFKGESQVEDSSIMYFKISLLYDAHSTYPPIIDTVRINNNQGGTMDYEEHETSNFRNIVRTIHANKITIRSSGQGFNSGVFWHDGILYRQ